MLQLKTLCKSCSVLQISVAPLSAARLYLLFPYHCCSVSLRSFIIVLRDTLLDVFLDVFIMRSVVYYFHHTLPNVKFRYSTVCRPVVL